MQRRQLQKIELVYAVLVLFTSSSFAVPVNPRPDSSSPPPPDPPNESSHWPYQVQHSFYEDVRPRRSRMRIRMSHSHLQQAWPQEQTHQQDNVYNDMTAHNQLHPTVPPSFDPHHQHIIEHGPERVPLHYGSGSTSSFPPSHRTMTWQQSHSEEPSLPSTSTPSSSTFVNSDESIYTIPGGDHPFPKARIGYSRIVDVDDENGEGSFRVDGEVPTEADVFHFIDLTRDNPDNHLALMEKLNHLDLARQRDPADYAKKAERLVQNARALGFLTSGYFPLAPDGHKSPAVHLVSASNDAQDTIIYSLKEQLARKEMIRKEQAWRRSMGIPHKGKGSECEGTSYSGYLSRHADLQDLNNDLQQYHDNLEYEQLSKYQESFMKGDLPRLKFDRDKRHFRLSKSISKQKHTRLYSRDHLHMAPNWEILYAMRQEDRERRRKGVTKVMDIDPSSSDDEFQLPRRTSIRHAEHSDWTKSSIPFSRPIPPYDLSTHL